MLGGDISVESAPGQGSTFRLTIDIGCLKKVELTEGAPSVSTLPQSALEGDGPTSLSCRVLLAEDGPDNQRLISFVLTKAGADVTLAPNGKEALELALSARAEGAPFDVILMDMQMPVMDGYAATRKLRELDYDGPIIALTAHAMSGDRKKCLDAGCDDYATKPIERDRFLKIVAQYGNHAARGDEGQREINVAQYLMSLVESRNAEARGFYQENRIESRTYLHFGVWVVPLNDDGTSDLKNAFHAVTRDCSASGMSFFAHRPLVSTEFLAQLPGDKAGGFLRLRVRENVALGAGYHLICTQVIEAVSSKDFPELQALTDQEHEPAVGD